MVKTITVSKDNVSYVRSEVEVARIKYNKAVKALKELHVSLPFEVVNLKLHEVSYKVNAEELGEHFEDFCRIEYDYFNELVQDRNLTLSYIGRTSSFVIESRDIQLYDKHLIGGSHEDAYYFNQSLGYKTDTPEVLYEYDTFTSALSSYIIVDGLEEGVARFIDDMDYFFRNVLGDLLSQSQDILYIYDYIETFKVNQLQQWSDYIRYEAV